MQSRKKKPQNQLWLFHSYSRPAYALQQLLIRWLSKHLTVH